MCRCLLKVRVRKGRVGGSAVLTRQAHDGVVVACFGIPGVGRLPKVLGRAWEVPVKAVQAVVVARRNPLDRVQVSLIRLKEEEEEEEGWVERGGDFRKKKK